MHHAKLLRGQLDRPGAVRGRQLLSERLGAAGVPRQQLLQPERHLTLRLRHVRQRPVHSERVQRVQQHRVRGVQ